MRPRASRRSRARCCQRSALHADVRDSGPSLISDIDGPLDVTQARRHEAVARRYRVLADRSARRHCRRGPRDGGPARILRSGTATYRWGAARVEAQQSARAGPRADGQGASRRRLRSDERGDRADRDRRTGRVAFQWDLDGDGVVDPTRERVTFLLRPGESTLRRDAGGGAQPIINGVKRFALTYFDAAGLATTDPDAVASIGIQIEVGLAGPSVAMRTQAALRNRGG